MQIRRVVVGLIRENCYIVSLPERQDCVLIDPGAEPERILAAAEGKRIAAILLTHGHFDHIGAVKAFAGEGTAIVVHRADAAMLGDMEINGCWLAGVDVTAPPATRLVEEGDVLQYAGITFTVLHTPGHTAGSVCYDTGEVLFTGDTVMAQGVGRTDLPSGSDEDMERSLRRLMPLLRQREVLGGHG